MNIDTPIRIRRYLADDVDAVCAAVLESRAELAPWMPWCHPDYSRADAATWVEGRPAAWERNEEWSFVIVDSTGRLLGSCGLHRVAIRDGVAELGYWVRTSATRRGVATEATRQLCSWGFRDQGLHRIEILTDVENVASQRVAVKAGGIREGVLRERLSSRGGRRDAVLWGVLNQER